MVYKTILVMLPLMRPSMVYMPHLACLGQMLEKGKKFAIEIFPEGLVLGRDCPNPLNLHIFSFIVSSVFGEFFVNSTDTHNGSHISLSHTVHNGD